MNNALLVGVLVVVVALIAAGVLLLRPTTNLSTEIPPLSSSSAEDDSLFTQTLPSPSESPALFGSPAASSLPTTTAPSAAATTEPGAGEAVTITVDDTGFTPGQVTIPVNTAVSFVNNGQGAHWPASDVHPTHQLLPGFDAKRGLATGETYTYTFTKVGTWPFHDHLNPRAKGSVVVQ